MQGEVGRKETGIRIDLLGPRQSDRQEAERQERETEDALPAATVNHAEKLIFEVQAELEQIQVRLSDFEHKYRMCFEEFQAALCPDSPPEIEGDCLEWSRWAERRRALLFDLDRVSRLRARLLAVPPREEENPAPVKQASVVSDWPGQPSRLEARVREGMWSQLMRVSSRLKRF